MVADPELHRKTVNWSWWRPGLLLLALLMWMGWAGYLCWLEWRLKDVPLGWHGLWDADSPPRLHPMLLGVQRLTDRASLDTEDHNAAFRIAPEGKILLGDWQIPSSGWLSSFSVWVRLEEPIASTNLVAFGGTAPPHEWGFGAWAGHPAVWYSAAQDRPVPATRIVAPDPWTVGDWKHLCMVVDGARVSLWVNGRRVADRVVTPGHVRRGDVWLGQVHRSRQFTANALRGPFGDPAPEIMLDDFAVYPRALSDAEVSRMARIGRGGLVRAETIRDWRENGFHRGTRWLVALSLVLIAAAVWQDIARRVLANWRLLISPSYYVVWLILLLGGGGSAWFAVRLAVAGHRADQERVDEFAHDLVFRGEDYFERVAELLRRARDVVRSNPGITLKELHSWGVENGVQYDFSGLDGIGWAPKTAQSELQNALLRLQDSTARDLPSAWQSLTNEPRWQLPVTAYALAGGPAPTPETSTMIGWDWLSVLLHQ